jgi:TonB family protein
MYCRLFTGLIGIVASSFLVPFNRLRAQESCRSDSDSVALADKLLDQVGNACDAGCDDYPAAWGKVRRAVEIAPLNNDRLVRMLQFSHFLNRPDSAIALANLARQRWPGCAIGDSALVRAKALPPQVFLESVVEERPEFISGPKLNYPKLLREAGVQGRVLVQAIIDSSGRAERASVRVIQSPNPGFDSAARDYILGALFLPGRVHGARCA